MNKYILYLLFLNAVLATSLICFWKLIFTDTRPFIGIILAAVFFFLYESIVIGLTTKKNKTISPRRSINLFMGLKVGKILLSLILVAIYAVAVKVEVKRFVLVFVALYFIYLLFDTIYLAKNEKNTNIF
jgi:hypothetical protein